jgi:hypothetical protein
MILNKLSKLKGNLFVWNWKNLQSDDLYSATNILRIYYDW